METTKRTGNDAKVRGDTPLRKDEEPLLYAIGECPLGAILVAGGARGVRAILIGDTREAVVAELGGRFPKSPLREDPDAVAGWLDAAIGLVEAPHRAVELPLDMRGTEFQMRVWQALCEIPVGRTSSYAQLAQRIGVPNAVRAVGRAIGANPLAVVVPCHRAIGSDGSLTGYRWGLERKRALLEREGRS